VRKIEARSRAFTGWPEHSEAQRCLACAYISTDRQMAGCAFNTYQERWKVADTLRTSYKAPSAFYFYKRTVDPILPPRSAMLRIIVLTLVSFSVVVASGSGDDFTNNLFSDVSPYVLEFGGCHTQPR
jgi:hypothetical protein